MPGKNISRLDRRIAAAKADEDAKAAAKAAGKPVDRADGDAKAAGTATTAKQEADRTRAPKLSVREWTSLAKRMGKNAHTNELLDRAAALTYYGFLAVFPTLLLAVSILGLVGTSAVNRVLDNIQKLAPGSVHDVLRTAITQVRHSGGTGGTLAVAGIAGALWSASGYVGAFIRASNLIYGVRRKRPMWKTMPLRIGLTVLMMMTSMVSVVIVVFTGPLAEKTATVLGLGQTAVTVWSIAKWPVLVLLVAAMIVLLFWAAPNVRSGRRFHWITPGSTLAVVLWLVLSTGFAAYVANFASYNKTYGAVAGVIVFLLWLWLSNLAILLGLEFDFELEKIHDGSAGAGLEKLSGAGNAGGPQAAS